MRSRAGPQSLELVDGLKAVACCLIVLHHLAFYGPMSDHAGHLLPSTFAWLSEYGRLAVQVFLVLGGWLAARTIIQHGGPRSPQDCLRRILQRYLRLAVPLWGALVIAVACNALADHWIDHHSISAPPDGLQVLMHLLLLQDLTGHEALSAGIWYVAIDLQLHALLLVVATAAAMTRRPAASMAAASLVLLIVSALILNRDPQWDSWAPYFWCSYGLGVMVALSEQHQPGPARTEWGEAHPLWLVVTGFVMVAALIVDFRLRLMLALLTAAVLLIWVARGRQPLGLARPLVRGISRISYAVFLIHFPVSLIVNALWSHFVPPSPLLQLLGVVLAFKLSLLGGWLFHEVIERTLWPHTRRLQAKLFNENAA